MTTTYHEPVLLKECIEALNIRPGGTYVDVTFGGGGHARAILERLGPGGRLIAFDRDEDALANAIPDERFTLVRHNYRYIRNFLRYYDAIPVDGILADLGISSHQVDEASRGFSTRFNASLDMRMNRENPLTAAEIINSYPEEELVNIFSKYGEVFNARTLARKILEARKVKKIEDVTGFRSAIQTCTNKQHESQYYAKVFQALRIEVNDELESLKTLLAESASLLRAGGRLVVISYHSLEDRLVKNLISRGKFEGEAEKDLFGNTLGIPFRAVNKKPIEATGQEVLRNPRARSAKLRIAQKN
jgi:16S rRNA (cytosine1402-N4)-methyltransferase